MPDLTLTCPDGADTEQGASKSGDYRLEWEAPEGATTRLVEAEPDGDVLYEGPQRASTVTGRPEGDYQYRVGIVEGGDVQRWSEPCEVLVRPYPLALALTFFGVGLIITLSTAALVLWGHRAHNRGEIG